MLFRSVYSFPTAVCETPVTILPATARYPPTVIIAAGKTIGEARIAPPTSPITTPIVLNKRKNLGVGATTLCKRVRSSVVLVIRLVFFILDRIIKDCFKLFYFDLKLTNPLIDQLQTTFKFALDELCCSLNFGNVLLHSAEIHMQQTDKINHQRQQNRNQQTKHPG